MVRRGSSDLSVTSCVRYNIGSFLAVLLLGYWYLFSVSSFGDPCPGRSDLPFEPGRGVNVALKSWSAKKNANQEAPAPAQERRRATLAEDGDRQPAGQEKQEEPDQPEENAEDQEENGENQEADYQMGDPSGESNNEGPTERNEEPSRAGPEASGGPHWIFCAAQWQECSCGGKVRWGNKDTWTVIKPKKEGKILDVKCNIQELQDIIPGDDGKHCQCQVTPGTKFYEGINPLKQTDEMANSRGAKEVSSCELFEEGKHDGPWGKAQWAAVEPFCSGDWEDRVAKGDPLLKAGDRKIDLPTMRQLMRARVDPRFLRTYEQLFASSGNRKGWAARAFVNYYAGSPEGKHAKMTEELIRSVHEFSSEPIVVVHFGMSTSEKLTPEAFPRLVLLHAEPFGHTLHRSFNFNKLRAFLMARVMAGVGLDSDQFVAPGVDRLFEMSEREITEDYPFAIMPVHFLDRGPKDLGVWWERYCPDKVCSLQTLRWGHAHPSWTYWALPFIGKWLRKNFRDETLPKITGETSAPALRVVDIPEDEDLLNVALWEDKATKQWCKYDITDPLEFQSLLDWSPKYGNRCSKGTGCSNIFGDKRFYKHGGAAKLFYTAHHAVVPTETRKYVARIQKQVRDGNWPTSGVVFDGKFWGSGAELRKAHPQLECLA